MQVYVPKVGRYQVHYLILGRGVGISTNPENDGIASGLVLQQRPNERWWDDCSHRKETTTAKSTTQRLSTYLHRGDTPWVELIQSYTKKWSPDRY
jgi:hypothetical protein